MENAGPPSGAVLDIPDFTISGVLPPFLGASPTIPAFMSPYQTTLTRIAEKLCGSIPRKVIFRGLIAYRQQLASLGLTNGFQWYSGSFMEDIESLEARNPNDIDVVTFCHRPAHLVGNDTAWKSFVHANLALLDPRRTKPVYKCDAYFVDLDSQPTNVVNLTRYWFGLFSHRRGGLWKGLLQVSIDVTQDDVTASAMVGPQW